MPDPSTGSGQALPPIPTKADVAIIGGGYTGLSALVVKGGDVDIAFDDLTPWAAA